MRTVLTADGQTFVVECLSCAVTSGLVESSGGTIAETDSFHAHQDIAYPIPRLVIVASKLHFYGLDEMSDDEAADYIQFLRKIRSVQRQVLGIEHIYYFYNEDTTHHFHMWMVPRYDWMNAFGRSVESVRPVLLHSRKEMATEDNLRAVTTAVHSLRLALVSAPVKSFQLIDLEPADLPTEANLILAAVYAAEETRLFGLSMGERVVGVMGIRLDGDSAAEILHIAVGELHRGRGYGRRMIELLLKAERLVELHAETDRDAVGFYRQCGFSIESLGEKYPGVERFVCRLGE